MDPSSKKLPFSGPLGTFVTVGTSLDPFDRLLKMLDSLGDKGALPLPLLIQSGNCTYVPRHGSSLRFLDEESLFAAIGGASVVLCHGGAGSIGMCLQLGRKPVVIPRRVAHGEIVNDHQLELCRAMLHKQRIYLAEDEPSLEVAIHNALTEGTRGQEKPARSLPLVREIASLLQKLAK